MSIQRRYVQHYRSNKLENGEAKKPSAAILKEGEIAVNYKDGDEALFIKNDNDEIVEFVSKEFITSAISAVTITVDSGLSLTSENPVENRAISNAIKDNEEVVSAALNDLNTRVNQKQDTLVSGTNIKTVNNNSLLGSGNLTIQTGETNVIEGITVNGTPQTPDANKNINLTIPTALSGLTADANHRLVTDTEKTNWNNHTGNTDIHVTATAKTAWNSAISSLTLSINSSTYVVTLSGSRVDGTTFTVPDPIDLPLETMVVDGDYDSDTKEVVLTLKSGTEVRFSVADLIDGLQPEITSTNKLSADLVEDGTTNKVVTATEKTTWNNKQDALTFDTTPTSGSTNPVTSGGIRAAMSSNERVIAAALNDLNDRIIDANERIDEAEEKTNDLRIFRGTCSTAAGTAAKVVDCDDFTANDLTKGAIIFVTFDATNSATASSLTMSVNSTTAKPIKKQYNANSASNLVSNGEIRANSTYLFQYDGTNWVCMTLDYNSTYSNVGMGNGYAVDSRSSAVSAVTATLSSYSLSANSFVTVAFTYDVPSGATLNVSGKGAKAIYDGDAAIGDGIIKAGDVATFVYNTNYRLVAINRDGGGVQADWNETNTSSAAFIKNKPTVPQFPLVIEVDDTATTVPSGTYASITSALSEGRDVVIEMTITEDDNHIEFLKIRGDYDSTSGQYDFFNSYWNSTITNADGDDDIIDTVYRSASNHTHGNIQSDGSLQTNDVTIANGDKLVVTDASNHNEVARTSIAFDGSTTAQTLSKAGTWVNIPDDNNLVHKTGAETIAGNKTFSNNITVNEWANIYNSADDETLQDALDSKADAIPIIDLT